MTENPVRVYHFAGPPALALYRRDDPDGRAWHYVEQQEGIPGAVIIPRDRSRILFQWQYRYPLRKALLQLPRGFGDFADRDSVQTAQRELKEETGLEATRITAIGPIYPDSGILTTRVDVFVAEVTTQDFNRALRAKCDSPGENIHEHVAVPVGELSRIIRLGQLCDGITLAALALALSSDPLAKIL